MSGNTWPEANAVNEWFSKHSMELCNMVSEFRIELQKKIDSPNQSAAKGYIALALKYREKNIKSLKVYEVMGDFIEWLTNEYE